VVPTRYGRQVKLLEVARKFGRVHSGLARSIITSGIIGAKLPLAPVVLSTDIYAT
jgi:hypothetical protein